jgi:hypothetical protein
MSTVQIVALVLLVVFAGLYVIRRRSRLTKDDD